MQLPSSIEWYGSRGQPSGFAMFGLGSDLQSSRKDTAAWIQARMTLYGKFRGLQQQLSYTRHLLSQPESQPSPQLGISESTSAMPATNEPVAALPDVEADQQAGHEPGVLNHMDDLKTSIAPKPAIPQPGTAGQQHDAAMQPMTAPAFQKSSHDAGQQSQHESAGPALKAGAHAQLTARPAQLTASCLSDAEDRTASASIPANSALDRASSPWQSAKEADASSQAKDGHQSAGAAKSASRRALSSGNTLREAAGNAEDGHQPAGAERLAETLLQLLLPPGARLTSSCSPNQVLGYLYKAILDEEDACQCIVSDRLRELRADFWKLRLCLAVQHQVEAASQSQQAQAEEGNDRPGWQAQTDNASTAGIEDIVRTARLVSHNESDRARKPWLKRAALAKLGLNNVKEFVSCPAALWEAKWLPQAQADFITSGWQAAPEQPDIIVPAGRELDQLLDELQIKLTPRFPWRLWPSEVWSVHDSSRLGPMRLDLEREAFLDQTSLARRLLDHKLQTTSMLLEVSSSCSRE